VCSKWICSILQSVEFSDISILQEHIPSYLIIISVWKDMALDPFDYEVYTVHAIQESGTAAETLLVVTHCRGAWAQFNDTRALPIFQYHHFPGSSYSNIQTRSVTSAISQLLSDVALLSRKKHSSLYRNQERCTRHLPHRYRDIDVGSPYDLFDFWSFWELWWRIVGNWVLVYAPFYPVIARGWASSTSSLLVSKILALLCSFNLACTHWAEFGALIYRRSINEQVWTQEPPHAALRVCLHRAIPSAHSLPRSIAIPYSHTCVYTTLSIAGQAVTFSRTAYLADFEAIFQWKYSRVQG
jgi:hypothetical protein